MSDSLADLPEDMRLAPRALRRAAQRARDVARATRTGLVIVRDGVLVEIPYDEIEDLDLSENEK